ncbi:MAG: aldose 1-epimerase family protein [Solirubrobacteraceae bacterium]
MTAPTGEQIELRHEDQRAVVVEVGAALRLYEAAGRRLLDGFEEHELPTFARGQVLIPWPNRLRDGRYEFDGEPQQLPLSEPDQGNAIHGLVRWAGWTVAQRDGANVRMEHRLYPREGYPFALALAIEYRLGPSGLTVTTSATNAGERKCPYGAGAHPYITIGSDRIDGCTLRAPGARWMRTDDRQIPTGSAPVDGTDYDFRAPRQIGATRLDTGYAELVRDGDGLARVTLTSPDDGSAVTLWQDESYPYVMLFTGDAVQPAERRRRGLGVEPMTCAPNALQTGEGLRTLAPGETASGSWGLSFEAG